eukprot:scaffold16058_cov171-Amphora_coffeaeformis.AAC.1
MTPCSKSLAVKYHWFRSKLSPTTCMVIPVASADNHADIFTKPPIRSFRSTPQEHLRLLCDFRLQLRANVITRSSFIFVHMGSSIYSHIDNPVQDYSPNKKSRQTKVRTRVIIDCKVTYPFCANSVSCTA